jgi:hypothetical protein
VLLVEIFASVTLAYYAKKLYKNGPRYMDGIMAPRYYLIFIFSRTTPKETKSSSTSMSVSEQTQASDQGTAADQPTVSDQTTPSNPASNLPPVPPLPTTQHLNDDKT